MKPTENVVSSVACIIAAAMVALGLVNLALRLKEVQLDDVVLYAGAGERQSTRRVRTDGSRGRIVDRRGRVLAANRLTLSVACDAAAYQKGSLSNTVARVLDDVMRVSEIVRRKPTVDAAGLRDAIRRRGAVPLELWHDVSDEELARFEEHSREYPGFFVVEDEDRVYPQAPLADRLIGSVRKAPGETDPSENFYWATDELRGCEGLECYYDAYLRGVPGEDRLRINSLGYTSARWTVEQARPGLDLRLALDAAIQHEAERQLNGCRGACVVMDPRTGDVLAAASSPGYFLAFGGEYAPGSTFKLITALAALKMGVPPETTHNCNGSFALGAFKLRCTSRWGHGPMDLGHALMKSCNPYFCNLGCDIGTNALFSAARSFGLGSRTGIDFVLDRGGSVPSAELKERVFHERWNQADLAATSIGQGMLLVTPLQMARVAGAIATGYMVRPRLSLSLPVVRQPLPFSKPALDAVRRGMRMVVDGDGESRGTGWRGAMDVPAKVFGKTGTAEVGAGASRRKNTWFVAYATPTNVPSGQATVSVAMVIERGESGGGTTAPKVAEVLRRCFER